MLDNFTQENFQTFCIENSKNNEQIFNFGFIFLEGVLTIALLAILLSKVGKIAISFLKPFMKITNEIHFSPESFGNSSTHTELKRKFPLKRIKKLSQITQRRRSERLMKIPRVDYKKFF